MPWIIASLLAAGLLLGGCEGPHFPWPNLIGFGLGLIGLGLLLLAKETP